MRWRWESSGGACEARDCRAREVSVGLVAGFVFETDKTRKDHQVDHHGSTTTSPADSASTMPCISEISYEVIVPFCGIPSLWP
jgi:hypothetical protein